MKQVRFFAIKDGNYEYIGRVVLNKGLIKFDGLPEPIKKLLSKGVVDWNSDLPRKQVLPKTGMKFLNLVVDNFRGSYLKALPIEEVDI